MKAIRIFLLVLIIIGIGLLVTQKLWVPTLVEYILKSEDSTLVTTNEVDSWEVYTDSRQRFTIKYPTGWHSVVNLKQDYVVFCPATDKECTANAVYVYVYTKGGSKDILNAFRKQGSGYEEKNIIIDGKSAIQREESYCMGTPRLTNGVFVAGSAYDFQIQGPYYECGSIKEGAQVNYDESLNIFNQMLTTFKSS